MKSNEPLISVIVPVRNGQVYLENCIRSIEGQTYGNIEVVIVNDGSTDATSAVCDRIKRDYDNLQVLTLTGKGVSAARNAGIDAAKGDFITFVDADDRICRDMVETLYNCMADTRSDVAGCRFFTWSNEEEWGQGTAGGKPHDKRAIQDKEEPVGRQAGQTYVYDASGYLKEAVLCGNSRCWSKLYRKEIFDKVRFPENLTIGEDMLFLVRMLPHVNRVAETDYQGYGYFKNPAGAMNREFTPRYMDQITCWELAREEIRRMDRSPDAQVTALCMMGIMLTAGKIAMLSSSGRRAQKEYIHICHKKLKETIRVPGAFGRLSAGYRLKAVLFMLCPNLYLCLYHLNKAIH